MAKILGQVDSLNKLLNILKKNGITTFSSLEDISLFKKNVENEINPNFDT